MDTTSHDFRWEIYTLGDGTGSSCLYDVAIINETLAYAVGEIYRNDTTFNVAKWNGKERELMRIESLVCGSPSYANGLAGQIIFFQNDDDGFYFALIM